MNEDQARQLLETEVVRQGWPLGVVSFERVSSKQSNGRSLPRNLEPESEFWLLSSNTTESHPRLHLLVNDSGQLSHRGYTECGLVPEPWIPFPWLQRFFPLKLIVGSHSSGRFIEHTATRWEALPTTSPLD